MKVLYHRCGSSSAWRGRRLKVFYPSAHHYGLLSIRRRPLLKALRLSTHRCGLSSAGAGGFVSARARISSLPFVVCATQITFERPASVRASLWLVACAARAAEILYLPTHGSCLRGSSFARGEPPLKILYLSVHRSRHYGSLSAGADRRFWTVIFWCEVSRKGSGPLQGDLYRARGRTSACLVGGVVIQPLGRSRHVLPHSEAEMVLKGSP